MARRRNMCTTLLRESGLFADEMTSRLAELDIDSVEEFLVFSQLDSVRGHLMASLDVEEQVFESLYQNLFTRTRSHIKSRRTRPLSAEETALFGTGIRVESPRPAVKLSPAARALAASGGYPAEISHVKELGPVKNQGGRGTCVAFGTAALREFLLGNKIDLSEQHLYWGTKMRDGYPDEAGTWIRFAVQCLIEQGVCEEKYWPYNPEQARSEHQGPPPEEAVHNAGNYRVARGVAVEASSVDELKACLAGMHGRKPCIVSGAILVFDSWYRNPITAETGDLSMPVPGEEPVGGHCIAIAGYCDDPDYWGGGYFIIRNSWGEKWGECCPDGVGYGRVPYAFMEHYGMEAYAAEAGFFEEDAEKEHKTVLTPEIERAMASGRETLDNQMRGAEEKLKKKFDDTSSRLEDIRRKTEESLSRMMKNTGRQSGLEE